MKRSLVLVIGMLSLSSCDLMDRIEHRAEVVNNYEKAALDLSKENRELGAEISRLRFEIQNLKSQNQFLKLQIEKMHEPTRTMASVHKVQVPENDIVKFEIYKWKPEELVKMAHESFDSKEYDKSAQYFQSFLTHYPMDSRVSDKFLFQAGVAAYESGVHHEWTKGHLERLVKEYPTSPYYRGAKLWIGLTHLKMGEKDKFFEVVEEFRKKYRNTEEWKILSAHYEKIVQKYKN